MADVGTEALSKTRVEKHPITWVCVTMTEEEVKEVQQDVATCWDFGSWQDRAKGEREQVQVFETGGRTVSLQMKKWERREYHQNQGCEPSLFVRVQSVLLSLCANCISQCVAGSRSSNVLWLLGASVSMSRAMGRLSYSENRRGVITLFYNSKTPEKNRFDTKMKCCSRKEKDVACVRQTVCVPRLVFFSSRPEGFGLPSISGTAVAHNKIITKRHHIGAISFSSLVPW